MREEELEKNINEVIDKWNKGEIFASSDIEKMVRTLIKLYNEKQKELVIERHYAKVYENMVKDYEKICIEKNEEIRKLRGE